MTQSPFIRRGLALYIMSFCATLILVDYFVKNSVINTIGSYLSQWAAIWASFALVIGVISFMRRNYGIIQKRQPGEWYFSVWMIVLMCIVVILGLVQGVSGKAYMWIWFVLSAWPYRVILLTQALYFVSAAYRSFRIRTKEALVLTIAGFIVLLGRTPIISMMGGPLVAWAGWLTGVANTAVNRGITIGIGVGVVALGFRLLIGKERMTSEVSVEGGGS